MKKISMILAGFFLLTAMSSDLPAYVIYNTKGKAVSYDKMAREAADADVVLFGELHNNPICHWLELELTRSLYAVKKDRLIMGAEMFETDNALLINELLAGKIKEKNFEAEAKLWPNYTTDYKPLLDFAVDSNIRFIATNIPRRYAAVVNKEGFEGLDALSAEAKSYIAPLPVDYDPDLPCYKGMLDMMGGAGGHVSANLPKAQAIKDATMAYTIAKNLVPGSTFIHFEGAYHSDNYEGIVWYLKRLKPNLKIMTISSVEQENTDSLDTENEGKADFTLVIPSTMTKTE